MMISESSPMSSSPCHRIEPPAIDKATAVLKEENAWLQEENIRLREEIASLMLDARFREQELNKFKSDYYSERFKANVRKRLSKSAERKHAAQNVKLKQAERFISSMIEIGLHIPVLHNAWHSVGAGRSPDRALVDAIQKAAATPGTSWSRIIPAVTGPRTPDEYLAAIDMVAKKTEDVHNLKKIANFWRTKASENSRRQDIIAPSPSQLSDKSTGSNLEQYKTNAVDDLLEQLKDSAHPAKAAPLSNELVSTVFTTPSRFLLPLASSYLGQDQNPSLPGGQAAKKELPIRKSYKPASLKQLRPLLQDLDLHIQHIDKWTSSRNFAENQSTKAQRCLSSELDLAPNEIQPSGNSKHLCPQDALLSLERICAEFSSGSLGSLAATSNNSSGERPLSPVSITRDPLRSQGLLAQPAGLATSLKPASALPRINKGLIAKTSLTSASCKALFRLGHTPPKMKLKKNFPLRNTASLCTAEDSSAKNGLPQPAITSSLPTPLRLRESVAVNAHHDGTIRIKGKNTIRRIGKMIS